MHREDYVEASEDSPRSVNGRRMPDTTLHAALPQGPDQSQEETSRRWHRTTIHGTSWSTPSVVENQMESPLGGRDQPSRLAEGKFSKLSPKLIDKSPALIDYFAHPPSSNRGSLVICPP